MIPRPATLLDALKAEAEAAEAAESALRREYAQRIEARAGSKAASTRIARADSRPSARLDGTCPPANVGFARRRGRAALSLDGDSWGSRLAEPDDPRRLIALLDEAARNTFRPVLSTGDQQPS